MLLLKFNKRTLLCVIKRSPDADDIAKSHQHFFHNSEDIGKIM